MGTVAGLAMAISAPIWGAMADRFGRKPMVVRSMLGGGVMVAMMAYATSPEQVLVVRMLHGALSGTVTACITMVSHYYSQTPPGFCSRHDAGCLYAGGFGWSLDRRRCH